MTSTQAYCSAAVRRAGTEDWIPVALYVHNTYTNAGRDKAHSDGYTNVTTGTHGANYVAVSADTGAPAAGDTTLTGEIDNTNGLGRALSDTHSHSNGTNTSSIVHTWTATGAVADIHKAALFNASSSGTMSHAAVFSSDVTLATNDQLQVTFTITLG